MLMAPDRWLVVTVRVPSEACAGALAEGLLALGGAAIEEQEEYFTTYVLPPEDPEAFMREARERLQAVVPDEELEVTWCWREHEDWAEKWRQGLEPRRVGRRLVVTPPWVEPELRPGDVVVVIEPGMAFGTGEHATTRGSLRLLEEAIRPGDRVLDVGTGSGILAIAAARLGAGSVVAVEGDGDALGNARENLERNAVVERVELLEAWVDEPFLAGFGPARFDLVVANVLSSVLEPLLPAFHGVLAASGRLILSGILEGEADRILAAAQRAGFTPVAEDREGEWWSGLLQRSAA
ncbi:MAG TPA: 50S ribosomal protein L11 methyltransferase [Longimicrobiales bacterium]